MTLMSAGPPKCDPLHLHFSIGKFPRPLQVVRFRHLPMSS
jgi:hypothetical protein